MTLIDFEELMEMYNNKYQEFNVYDLRFLKKEYLPIVEAIPIKWLKSWFETQVWQGSSPTDRIHCKASDIIDDWVKENGRKAKPLIQEDVFGKYCKIAYGSVLEGKQNYHIYKCIGRFESNFYSDVPLTYQTENNPYNHGEVVDVMNVIHCGLDETKVIRVAIKDVEFV